MKIVFSIPSHAVRVGRHEGIARRISPKTIATVCYRNRAGSPKVLLSCIHYETSVDRKSSKCSFIVTKDVEPRRKG